MTPKIVVTLRTNETRKERIDSQIFHKEQKVLPLTEEEETEEGKEI